MQQHHNAKLCSCVSEVLTCNCQQGKVFVFQHAKTHDLVGQVDSCTSKEQELQWNTPYVIEHAYKEGTLTEDVPEAVRG